MTKMQLLRNGFLVKCSRSTQNTRKNPINSLNMKMKLCYI